jgi:flagellar motility protein MotE (MotC chaperone)
VLPLTDPDIITGSTGAPAEKKSELQNSEKETATVPSSENKDVQASVADADKAANASSAKPSSTAVAPIDASQQGDAERTLLERLGLRRSELEKREEELSKREALLQAAEKRLSERSDELLRLEADLKSRTDQRNAELLSLKPIVTIYETMKPKDAARVFEKLDFSNLLTVSAAMNPRKLSDVLAQMDPALAGKLTKSLSTQNRAAVLPPPLANADTGNELPDFNPQGTP